MLKLYFPRILVHVKKSCKNIAKSWSMSWKGDSQTMILCWHYVWSTLIFGWLPQWFWRCFPSTFDYHQNYLLYASQDGEKGRSCESSPRWPCCGCAFFFFQNMIMVTNNETIMKGDCIMNHVNWLWTKINFSSIFKHKFSKFIKRTKIVTTLALGSWPKQGLAKVRAKSEARKSHFMLPGV
jgi:hypothetical protein